MVVSVDRIRGEYERVESVVPLRCAYGYSNTIAGVQESRGPGTRLDRILRNMEGDVGTQVGVPSSGSGTAATSSPWK